MKNGLNRQAIIGDVYDKTMINVFDLSTKQIVFTGDAADVGKFVGLSKNNVRNYLKRKTRLRKKYCFRLASTK